MGLPFNTGPPFGLLETWPKQLALERISFGSGENRARGRRNPLPRIVFPHYRKQCTQGVYQVREVRDFLRGRWGRSRSPRGRARVLQDRSWVSRSPVPGSLGPTPGPGTVPRISSVSCNKNLLLHSDKCLVIWGIFESTLSANRNFQLVVGLLKCAVDEIFVLDGACLQYFETQAIH